VTSTKCIALLGATSHIAKNIICELGVCKKYQLHLYARSMESVGAFLSTINYTDYSNIKIYNLGEFGIRESDVIINCIGIGNPSKLMNNVSEIFEITEYYDNLIINYLKAKANEALYINLSSGAAYGTDFNSPVNELSCLNVEVNHLTHQNYYGISKMYSEAKHRSLEKFNVVDLRIFSFFSRFIDLNSKFLIAEILNCLFEDRVFQTGSNELIRDYVSPRDLCELIMICIDKQYLNDVFDVYSLSPVSKLEIVGMFHDQFGLKYNINENISVLSNVTGTKSIYHSINKRAEKLHYSPSMTSLETIKEEANKMLIKGGRANEIY
jgi:nucleoside-diphosphate-sugar epimerase